MKEASAPATINTEPELKELPEGWEYGRVADLMDLVNGFAFKPSHWKRKGLPIIRIQNLNNADAVFNHCPDSLPSKYLVAPGDLLFAWSGTPGTSFGAHIWRGGKAWLNQHIFRVDFNPHLLNKSFLRLAINHNVDDYIDQAHGGVGLAHITKGRFEDSLLQIPPLAEQARVVDAVEAILARVGATRQSLRKASKILKAFRQTILAAACAGRLTEDWRRRCAEGESVTAIVESIRKRREAETTSATQKERLREIYTNSEENDSGELPNTWRFVALNKLCASCDYGTSAKSHPSGKMPVLRMGNIQRGEIDWTDLVYTSDNDEIRHYGLRPNTVLFNRTNSPELVGKTAIYRGERPAVFAGYLIRIAHLPELNPHYLNLCLNTTYAREFCLRVKTDGVSQSNINAHKLGMFKVPFCPPAEQHEIVRRVNALFKLADNVEERVAAVTKRTDKLAKAILAKAFRGELVPREVELARREGRYYEPASVLVERIISERATVEMSSKGATGKHRSNRAGKQ